MATPLVQLNESELDLAGEIEVCCSPYTDGETRRASMAHLLAYAIHAGQDPLRLAELIIAAEAAGFEVGGVA